MIYCQNDFNSKELGIIRYYSIRVNDVYYVSIKDCSEYKGENEDL